jgi:hypothetical protein
VSANLLQKPLDACYVAKDSARQKLTYVYFQDEAEIGGQIIDIEQRRPL